MMLIWNKVYAHRMLSPSAHDSCSGLSRPQEDNAGTPATGISHLETTAPLLRTWLSLSKPVDLSPALSPPVSSSVLLTENKYIKTRWQHLPES